MPKLYRVAIFNGLADRGLLAQGAGALLATGPLRRVVVAAHPRHTFGTRALLVLMADVMYRDTAQGGQYGRQALRLATKRGNTRRPARVSHNLATLAAMGKESDKSVRLPSYSARQFARLGDSLCAGHNQANAALRRVQQGRFARCGPSFRPCACWP